jgi:hypothetical protein
LQPVEGQAVGCGVPGDDLPVEDQAVGQLLGSGQKVGKPVLNVLALAGLRDQGAVRGCQSPVAVKLLLEPELAHRARTGHHSTACAGIGFTGGPSTIVTYIHGHVRVAARAFRRSPRDICERPGRLAAAAFL